MLDLRNTSTTTKTSNEDLPLVEFIYSLYLHACHVRVTVGDSGLCCCTCVTYLQPKLSPLCVDSARALWASFCFRFVVYELFVILPLTINENIKMAVIAVHRNAGVSLAVTEKRKV